MSLARPAGRVASRPVRRARLLLVAACSLGLLAACSSAEPGDAPPAGATVATTSTGSVATSSSSARQDESPQAHLAVESACAAPGVVHGEGSPATPTPAGVKPIACAACGYEMWPDWLDCPQCRTRRD